MEQISEALETVRTAFPFALFTFVPVLLFIVSPIAVDAAHDFKVYRMQQYDIQGNSHGELKLRELQLILCNFFDK